MDRSTTERVPVEFRVLGPIEVRVDGLSVDIGGFRQRRLLALLLSRAGGVIETDALAEYVWDDEDRPDNAVEAARTYISRLRRSFSEAGLDAASLIVTQAPGYRLTVDDAEVDGDRFEQLVLRARSQLDGGDTVSALIGLDDAIARWRGIPYQEFADLSWIESEVARLTELHMVAVEQRAAARLDLGAHAEVVGDLEKLVGDEPLRARPVELLMLALYRSGRQAEALRAASRYRRAVGDVGLDPSESFTELETRIAASDDDLQPVTASTDTIRGYRLADRIGEGSFSVVYRSVQPSLGREVAVKQIRAELADRPDFIRRFETEAQTVAALEHPHIVPLYDYWREPGSAYLVMRWLRGGTLSTRLRRQRLDADESVTLVTQIGSALAAAHHAGIEHRDVRTSNVFVDEFGNNYLGDFGIASDTQHNGGRDDTRGLGNLLFEAVTGKRADGNGDRAALSTLRPDLPPAVEPVLLRAMVGSGDEAYATVDEFVDDYVTAIDGTARRSAGSTVIPLAEDVVNPYKGLRAFQESDAEDFRGRDRLIDRLLHQLAEPGTAGRLVAAVGPSGSGKSSLVRAGLIPRIRTGAIAGSDTWFVTTMIPGPRPFDEIEAALNRIAIAPTAGLAETMSVTPHGITRAVNSTVPDETSELLLVIDQFEELFTLAGEETMAAFLGGLVTAVTDPRARLRVVITIRADHWHRPLQHPDLAQLLETSAITVTPMVADELERAIVDPARSMGVSFEPGLVADIVAEVHDQPGALPLMQYLLTELFDEREAGLMELDTYRRLGGVAGGLARRADDLFEQSTHTERDCIRRLFARLITPGEGTEDTRRRVALSELSTVPDAVIKAYGDARLLTFDHDPVTREPTVEVAHEALIREWPRLRGWVDDDRDGLRTFRHLTTAAAEWERQGRASSELYRGGRLETAEHWTANRAGDLTPVEQEFLRASVEQRAREHQIERRRIRRLRTLVAVASVIAVIAAATGAFALWARGRAEDERKQADVERVRATAFVVVATDPALAMLLAAEADRIDPSMESKDVLHRLLSDTNGVERYLPASYTELWLTNGGLTAVALGPDGIDLWDLKTGEKTTLEIERPPSTGATARRIDVSDSSGLMAISDEHGTDVYSLDTGETTWSAFRPAAEDVVFSPDGTQLAVAFLDETVIWTASAATPAGPTTTLPGARTVAWHPKGDGFVIITPTDAAEYWPSGSPAASWTVEGSIDSTQRPMILFTSDGDEVVVTQNEPFGLGGGSIRRLSVTDGSQLGDTREFTTVIDDWMWFDEERRHLGTVGASKGLLTFDLVTGGTTDPPLESLTAWTLDYSEALERFVVGGTLGIALHNPAWDGPLEQQINFVDPAELDHRGGPGTDSSIRGSNEIFREHVLSRDGTRLLVSGWSPSEGYAPVVEYDMTSDPVLARPTELTGLYKGNHGHALHLTDGGIAAVDDERRIVGNRVPYDDRFAVISDPSPDGAFFAVSWLGSASAELYRSSGELVARLVVPGAGDGWLDWSFSGDGSRIVGHEFGGNTINAVPPWAMWDTHSGEMVDSGTGTEFARPWLAGDTMYVSVPTATGELDYDVYRIDPETHEPVGDPLRGQRSLRAAVLDDGVSDLIVTHGFDGAVRLWDRATGEQVGSPIPEWYGNTVRPLQFGGNGTILARITPVAVSIWNIDTSTWADVACEFAGRNMTAEEWDEFGPDTIEHRKTCPDHPLDM